MLNRWQRTLALLAFASAGAACKSTSTPKQETQIPERAPVTSEATAPSASSRGASSTEGLEPSRGTSNSTAPAAHLRLHVVKRGDTLFSIARAYYAGDASKWRTIYEANREKIPDKDHIKVGQELVIPD